MHPGQRGVGGEQRGEQLDRVIGPGWVGPGPNQGPGGEVLDLPLAVDGRVGDHRDGFLEKLCQVRLSPAQSWQLSVVPQAGDGLGARLGDVPQVAFIPLLQPESDPSGRVDLVAVLSLYQWPVRPIQPAAGGAEGGSPVVDPVEYQALDLLVGMDAGLPALQLHHHLLPGRQRGRVAHHLAERDDSPLGAPEVLLLGLAEPQRPQAQGVHRADQLVGLPGDDRSRSLGQRPPSSPQAHVGFLLR